MDTFLQGEFANPLRKDFCERYFGDRQIEKPFRLHAVQEIFG